MRKLWSIFVLLFVAIFAVKAANTNYLTHCLTSGTAKPFVIQWDFYFMGGQKLTSERILHKLQQNQHYRNGDFWFVSAIGDGVILIEDKYGLLKASIHNLSLQGNKPTIQSAVNKNTYFANQAKEIHGDKYDYSKGNYVNDSTNIIINCPIHGDFKQTPDKHIRSKQGCPECWAERKSKINSENPTGWSCTNWLKAAKNSKQFDSFKVYVLRVFNDTESFYKIGRTFRKINIRFGKKSNLPYKYELFKLFEGSDGRRIYELETKLKREHAEYKYIPELSFRGMQECFSKINI